MVTLLYVPWFNLFLKAIRNVQQEIKSRSLNWAQIVVVKQANILQEPLLDVYFQPYELEVKKQEVDEYIQGCYGAIISA